MYPYADDAFFLHCSCGRYTFQEDSPATIHWGTTQYPYVRPGILWKRIGISAWCGSCSGNAFKLIKPADIEYMYLRSILLSKAYYEAC